MYILYKGEYYTMNSKTNNRFKLYALIRPIFLIEAKSKKVCQECQQIILKDNFYWQGRNKVLCVVCYVDEGIYSPRPGTFTEFLYQQEKSRRRKEKPRLYNKTKLFFLLILSILLLSNILPIFSIISIFPLSVVLKQTPQIKKQPFGTIFLSGEEMGSGKTERAIKEIPKIMQKRPKSKILYLLPDHPLCEEIVERLALVGVFARHLYGWEKLCPRYLAKEPEIIKLYSKKERKQYNKKKGRNNAFKRPLSTTQICGLCSSKKNCFYHTQFQFQDGDVVVAPQGFIHTPIVKKVGWSAIYVDDIDILSYTIQPSIKGLDQIFQVLANHYAFMLMRKRGVKLKPFYELSKYDFNAIIKQIEIKSKLFYAQLVEQKKLQIWLFYNKGKLRKYRYVLINPDIDAYKYYWIVRNTYRWKIPRVAYLDLFILLEKTDLTKITLIGRQTPARKYLLEKILEKYEKEKGKYINYKELPRVTNPNKPPLGTLYHVCPEGRAPRTTLRRKDREPTRARWDIIISMFIDKLQKKGMYIARIGVIIFKEFGNKGWLRKEFPLIFIQFKLRDIEVLTYGKLRGVNKFIKVHFVIVFGAYTTCHRSLILDHNLIFLEKHQQLKLGKVKPLGNEKKGFYYDDSKYPTLEAFRAYKEWDEMTQAIGRSIMRGIDTVIVGDVPDYLVKTLGDNYKVLNFIRDQTKSYRAYINLTEHNHKILQFLWDYFVSNGYRKMKFQEVHEILRNERFYVKKKPSRFYRQLKELAEGSNWFSWEKTSHGKTGRPKIWLVKRRPTLNV